MGIDWKSTAVIGYKLVPAKTYDLVNVPNCKHEHSPLDRRCQTCGAVVGTHAERRSFKPWDDFTNAFNEHPLPEGYVFSYDYENEWNGVFIGYGRSFYYDDQPVMLPVVQIDEIKTKIKKILQPWLDAGLFTINEGNFGFWTMIFGH